MKYNIIGDIHGRTDWKQLFIEDAVNVFVGDYFSPYDDYSFEDCKANFLEIIKKKQDNLSGVVLLLGNHDADYYKVKESGVSRHDFTHEKEIEALFEEYHDLFQIAYSIDNKVLVTHAGVSSMWYYPFSEDIHPDVAAKIINDAWDDDPQNFNFGDHCSSYDSYGTSATQSPQWIRPQTLIYTDIYKNTDYVQVFGHTRFQHVVDISPTLWGVDCLGQAVESLIYDTETKEFTVQDVQHS